MEPFYPLRAFICERCFLMQLEAFESAEDIFREYTYFSSFSTSWLEHSKRYAEAMVERLGLDGDTLVVELASNDGYLLQYFHDAGIPVLGVEPAANVAEAAIVKGIPTVVKFFGVESARSLAQTSPADLLIGNNVLAHVPDLNDFVGGMKILLAEGGTITMEFPHLVRLIEDVQFDTIYHEHFSYFTMITVQQIFSKHGLEVFDVEELPTHGGSLRIFARHAGEDAGPVSDALVGLLRREHDAGYGELQTYLSLGENAQRIKRDLLRFMIEAKSEGKSIVAYGAPAKGNTLLNYCGIGTDFIDYTVDRSPHKQGLFLPGTHIPVKSPDEVATTRPDYLFILPWNLKNEIVEQMSHVRDWGGKFVVHSPAVEIIE
jgi:hypothetical protein